MYTKTNNGKKKKDIFFAIILIKALPISLPCSLCFILKTTDSCQNKGSRMLLGPSSEDSPTLKRRFYNAALGWYAVKTYLP